MGVVGPIPEAREIAVGARFAGVLRRRLAVHLQDAAAWFPEHAAHEVDVVDLHGGRRGLVGLVEALQHGREQPLRPPDDPCGLADLRGRYVADLRGEFGGVRPDLLRQFVEADGVRVDVRAVDPAVADDLVEQGVHQCHVGARPRRQVHRRHAGDRCETRVDADDRRWVRTGQPVEDAAPEHGLGLGHVVAVERDDVGVVDVGVAPRLTVAGEGLLQGRRSGRGAQPCVAVDVVGADAAVGDEPEGVVLLQEELTGRVEADGARPLLLQQRPAPVDHRGHRGVPVGLDQFPVPADQRPGQPVGGVVGLPAEEVLGAQPATVHAVHRAAADADDPVVLDGDVEPVTVRVQDRRGLHPAVDLVLGEAVGQIAVHPRRPRFPRVVGGPATPGLGDAVDKAHGSSLQGP